MSYAVFVSSIIEVSNTWYGKLALIVLLTFLGFLILELKNIRRTHADNRRRRNGLPTRRQQRELKQEDSHLESLWRLEQGRSSANKRDDDLVAHLNLKPPPSTED